MENNKCYVNKGVLRLTNLCFSWFFEFNIFCVVSCY